MCVYMTGHIGKNRQYSEHMYLNNKLEVLHMRDKLQALVKGFESLQKGYCMSTEIQGTLWTSHEVGRELVEFVSELGGMMTHYDGWESGGTVWYVDKDFRVMVFTYEIKDNVDVVQVSVCNPDYDADLNAALDVIFSRGEKILVFDPFSSENTLEDVHLGYLVGYLCTGCMSESHRLGLSYPRPTEKQMQYVLEWLREYDEEDDTLEVRFKKLIEQISVDA